MANDNEYTINQNPWDAAKAVQGRKFIAIQFFSAFQYSCLENLMDRGAW